MQGFSSDIQDFSELEHQQGRCPTCDASWSCHDSCGERKGAFFRFG